MSDKLSRRDFFTLLANPVTRAAKRVTAREQRTRNLQAFKQDDTLATCLRCAAPYPAAPNESLCPDCRAAEAKNRALIQSLFKHQ